MAKLPRSNLLDILTNMRVEWTDETDVLMSVIAGMIMKQNGVTDMTLNLAGVATFLADNVVDREYYQDTATGDRLMRITVTDRK